MRARMPITIVTLENGIGLLLEVQIEQRGKPMGRVKWFAVIATLGMISTCILLVLGQVAEAAVGAQLTIAAAIMAHLR